jgi:hypothetical protein
VKNKKRIFIALGSMALVVALFVGSYIIRQNQYQAILTVSEMMNNEDIELTTTEYGTTLENEKTDKRVVSKVENVSELSAEPSPKLEKMYEDAMADSDLDEVEKEQIRFMIWKENKEFEEALQAVRPGSKVVYEETETQIASNSPMSQQQTVPSEPSNDNQKSQQQTASSEPTSNNNNTLKPITPNSNDMESVEKQRVAMIAGIEKMKAEYPGYDKEWDILANEYYTTERISESYFFNAVDELAMLDFNMYRRDYKPPMKGIQEYEMCEWKHMPTFTADMSEHDSENCCICTPELEGKGEHEVKYFESWSF